MDDMNGYEGSPARPQDLTFESLSEDTLCQEAFQANPDLVMGNGSYTNLALLFSDQCPFPLLVTIFKDSNRLQCQERRAFSGSIVSQLSEAMGYLRRNEVFERPDYPAQAIKETLVNSICHRDYLMEGGNQISVFPDRMEFVSLGGLFDSLDIGAIRMGVAHSRNPRLATMLYCMNLMDNYGTGIDKILFSYRGQERQPSFQAAEGLFKVTLPNCNYHVEQKRRKAFFVSEQDQILAFAKDQGFVTRREVEELLASGSTKSFKILRQLCDQKLLRQSGKGKNSVYLPMTSN